jgi:hypothetical protein
MPRTRSVVTAQSFESIAHLHQTFGLAVVTLNTQGFRILVGDMQESVSSPFIKLQKIACSFSRTTVSHTVDTGSLGRSSSDTRKVGRQSGGIYELSVSTPSTSESHRQAASDNNR